MVTRGWCRWGGGLGRIGLGQGRMWLGLAVVLALALAGQGICAAAEAKYGGMLNATSLEEAPPSFSIHEEATVAAVWPVMHCYNNLVLYRSSEEAGKRGDHHRGVGGEVSLARSSWEGTQIRRTMACFNFERLSIFLCRLIW